MFELFATPTSDHLIKTNARLSELNTRGSPRLARGSPSVFLVFFGKLTTKRFNLMGPHFFDVLYLSSTNDRSLSPSR